MCIYEHKKYLIIALKFDKFFSQIYLTTNYHRNKKVECIEVVIFNLTIGEPYEQESANRLSLGRDSF